MRCCTVASSSRSRPNSSVLRRCTSARRRRSIARCLAVAISQAPGLSGTPACGHCSSAATSASWARSSARPTSPVIRASAAISLADSIRQTASIAAWVAEALIASPCPVLLVSLPHLADALLLLAQLRGELVAEVLGLVHGTQLDHGLPLVWARAALHP